MCVSIRSHSNRVALSSFDDQSGTVSCTLSDASSGHRLRTESFVVSVSGSRLVLMIVPELESNHTVGIKRAFGK